jgi:outer membrane lipoprotein-sorting protein
MRLPSTRRNRIYAVVATVAVLAVGGGIAQAALDRSGAGPKPPSKPLAQAVMAALQAPKIEGISANIRVTNNLLPAGSLPKGVSSPLAAGGEGRLWLSADHRLRLDLHTTAGDVQAVYDGKRASLYDESSNTVYTIPVPAAVKRGAQGSGDQLPFGGLQQGLGALLRFWNLSGAKPTSTAGRPSYTVRISPKDDGGLLGAAEVAWDAERGVPLRAAVYAQGSSDPVVEIAATKIAYGPVKASDLAATPHPGAKSVEINPDDLTADSGPTGVTGVDAVQRRLDFHLAAPDELAGLARKRVELVSFDSARGAVSIYGDGLGTIAVFQYRTTDNRHGTLSDLNLPEVNIDGRTGKELATALGTMVSFERDGIGYLVAGLVPPVAAENAARGLR